MQISLLSLSFLALSATAIPLVIALRGQPRQLAFLAVNLVFIVHLLLGPLGALSSVTFVVLGWVLLLLIRRWPRAGLTTGVVILTAVFVYMRRYDFLSWLLPASLLTDVLATAGLSFLLFKILHVMIEARSDTLGRFDLATYLNYCLNFTTFAMGPIQRYQDYREQWDGERPAIALDLEAHLDAVIRILRGMIKAYVLAPWLLPQALAPDENLLALSLPGLLLECYAFWFYLYFNFSGYCDVVIGIGSLLGVRPPENFNMPFLARNISDFWLRQHRSLTLWLTDYVFTPAYKKALSTRSGSRRPLLAAVACLMLTMLVSGLWHGTTFSFLLFGLFHGLWFVIYRLWDTWLTKRMGKKALRAWRQRWPVRLAGIALTFNATALTFVFFQVRPENLLAAFRGLMR